MSDQVLKIVKQALNEDIGSGDVSASLLPNTQVEAHIIAREAAIIFGIDYAQHAFLLVDNSIQINWKIADGDQVVENQTLCTLSGLASSIVSAERVALNFLQTLSATATQTQSLVAKIAHTKAQLLDTRKTLPGLRLAQKNAVKCGGGVNHRMGLYDCVMLKENHIATAGSIKHAVKTAVDQYPDLPLIVEVESLEQLQQVLELDHITRALCDNFSINDLSNAVKLAKGKLPLEASGNIDENNISDVAETGVDYISTGSITKNINAIDLSLRFG
ncbi:Quinolinate phosphoribosyltransferase [decarboxylating] [hydrothermal vent metagenome]|uniref:Probable nicotinate-nucleotide pyrophosphorylase [carboxylating] n=1 Tax=hydrothermal vent metagenome TaxID=652676 RepID=A0A1W1DEE7_9ZZZZ